jgi:rhomboid family GlyGly-CTERM serine protease
MNLVGLRTGGSRSPLSPQIPCVALVLGLAAVIVACVPTAAVALEYRRGGEVWRILTGHWTHFTLRHMLFDVLPFIGVGIACERKGRGRFLLCVLLSALTIPLAIFLFQPAITVYRGLSGIDSAFFGLLAGLLLREGIRDQKRGIVAFVLSFLILFGAKIVYECLSSGAIFASDMGEGVVVVPLAHGVGFLIGTAMAWLEFRHLVSLSHWRRYRHTA